MNRFKAAMKPGAKNEVLDENEAQKRVTRKQNATMGASRPVLAERKTNTTKAPIVQKLKPSGKEEVRDQHKRTFSTLKFGGGSTLMPVDCAEDIDLYMRHLETRNQLPANFLSLREGGGVDGRMRQILVDWLLHVQDRFDMNIETVSLAVHLLDRCLISLDGIDKKNLQLLGVTCLFIASKFEEIIVPDIGDFTYVAANIFHKTAILRMEQRALQALNFDLSQPHAITFMRRYRFYLTPERHTWALAKFISEAAMVSYSLAHHPPSVVAAVSLYLALFTFATPPSSQTVFAQVFRMDEARVVQVARTFVEDVIQFLDPDTKLYALRQRYQKQVVDLITDEHLQRLRDFGDNMMD